MKKNCSPRLNCLGILTLSFTAFAAHATAPVLSGAITETGTISVVTNIGAIVSIYKLSTGATACNSSAITSAGAAINATAAAAGAAAGVAASSQKISVNPTLLGIAPLPAGGDVYCLVANTGPGTDTSYAIVQPFAAPPAPSAIPAKEPYFAHSFYTVGAVISNQLSTSNSTTAAQYVDLGFSFKFKTEGDKYSPGFNSSLAGRFTSIPVAAGGSPAATPASTSLRGISVPGRSKPAADAATDTSTPLNVLSSQESARIMGSFFVPFKVTATTGDGDALYLGPVAKASFSTLINPSETVAPTVGTVLIAPQFAPTYNDWSLGGRLGWRRYPGDSSVQTVWQIDATMGKFSNLQDIFCNHNFATPGVATAPLNTSCYDSATSGGITSYTTFRTDRVSNPRLEIDGFAHIPATIFVIGIDANLSQYGFHKAYTDTMNRAGSDVRIYFGITGSISDLFKRLTLPTAP